MNEENLNVKILQINISGLFGYREVNIDLSKNDNLVIFYGDNGSGKTTVLNLIYHIFSPEPRGGHRTAVGNIIFELISIILSNKIEIILKRDEAKQGPYRLIIKESDDEIINWNWYPNKHQEEKDEGKIEYEKYCNLMEKLGFNIFYLPANRRTDEDDIDDEESIIVRDSENSKRRIFMQDDKISSLTKALRQFQQWSRQEMIKKTNVGNRNINDLYNEIINGVIYDKKSTDDLLMKDKILNRISDIESRNKEYKKYGLSEDFLKEEIVEKLKENTDNNTLIQIATVLSPYLESVNLRLKSLEELQFLLSKFENNINNLFSEKKIIVSVENGIVIESPVNNKLDPKKLSSGEKQLLLMFCNVISSWGNSQLIIIDEPEISLNIKWQRMFVNSILDIVDKKNTQLFIATHSIEMLSRYKNNIHQLGIKNEYSE